MKIMKLYSSTVNSHPLLSSHFVRRYEFYTLSTADISSGSLKTGNEAFSSEICKNRTESKLAIGNFPDLTNVIIAEKPQI